MAENAANLDPGQQVKTRGERVNLDESSATVSVNASQTLAELGITLPANTRLVTINNPSSTKLHMNPTGEADANSPYIQGQSIDLWNDDDTLNSYEFYTGSATDIGVFVFTIPPTGG